MENAGAIDRYLALLLAIIDFLGILAPSFFFAMRSYNQAIQRGENPFFPSLVSGFFGVLIGTAVVAGIILAFEGILHYPAREKICYIITNDSTICSQYR